MTKESICGIVYLAVQSNDIVMCICTCVFQSKKEHCSSLPSCIIGNLILKGHVSLIMQGSSGTCKCVLSTVDTTGCICQPCPGTMTAWCTGGLFQLIIPVGVRLCVIQRSCTIQSYKKMSNFLGVSFERDRVSLKCQFLVSRHEYM